MKKKFLAMALIFAIAAALCPKIATTAVTAESDFVIENGVLTAYNGPGGDIVIPDGITLIGTAAFRNNTSITGVVIPDSAEFINPGAFNGCTALISVTIPDSMQFIYSEAFYGCTALTSIAIPDSVQQIDDSAFYGCTALTHVTIPDSLTEIGARAFAQTPWLKSLGEFAVVNGVLLAYQGHDSSIVIPAGITKIASKAFSTAGSHYYTNVTIPEGVTSIGSYAFDDCTNLTNVTIPDSITSIGRGAFRGTPWLAGQGEFVITDSGLLFAYQGTDRDIVIPSGVTALSDELFSFSMDITSVTIPNSVVSIGGQAFSTCSNLTEVNIPDSVAFIGEWAFCNCNSLTSISIPGNVTALEDSVFYGCSSLVDVVLHDGLETIGCQTFINCTGLAAVRIPHSVKKIGDSAFYGCSNLQKVFIPSSVTSIEESAFGRCSTLTDLTILEGTTSIGRNALYGLPDGAIVHGVAGSFAEGHIKENYPNLVFVADQPAGLIFRGRFGPQEGVEVMYQKDGAFSIVSGAIPAGHRVFVAYRDETQAFRGVKILTSQVTKVSLPPETDSVLLFWLDETLIPQCPACWVQF